MWPGDRWASVEFEIRWGPSKQTFSNSSWSLALSRCRTTKPAFWRRCRYVYSWSRMNSEKPEKEQRKWSECEALSGFRIIVGRIRIRHIFFAGVISMFRGTSLSKMLRYCRSRSCVLEGFVCRAVKPAGNPRIQSWNKKFGSLELMSWGNFWSWDFLFGALQLWIVFLMFPNKTGFWNCKFKTILFSHRLLVMGQRIVKVLLRIHSWSRLEMLQRPGHSEANGTYTSWSVLNEVRSFIARCGAWSTGCCSNKIQERSTTSHFDRAHGSCFVLRTWRLVCSRCASQSFEFKPGFWDPVFFHQKTSIQNSESHLKKSPPRNLRCHGASRTSGFVSQVARADRPHLDSRYCGTLCFWCSWQLQDLWSQGQCDPGDKMGEK